MTFTFGKKTFTTNDMELLRLIKEAAKKKDAAAVQVMIGAGMAFKVITEIAG